MKSLHIVFFLLAIAVFVAAALAIYGPGSVLRAVMGPFKAYCEQMFVLSIKPSPKDVVVITPVSMTAAGVVTGRVDTLGFDYLTLPVVLGTADTTAHQPTALKLSESDDTTTTVTDIVACVGGTATSATVGYVIPAADTSNPQIVAFRLDLKKRKRYIKLSLTAATVQLVGAVASLHVGEQEPTNSTDAGVNALITA